MKVPPMINVIESGAYIVGANVRILNDDGWLHVIVTADESIIGYAVTVNGKDLPAAAVVSAEPTEPGEPT